MNLTQPPAFPLAARWVALACALFLLAGIAHQPWKADDAVHLGIAWGFYSGDGWLIPRIAGEAWAGVAPGYHWVAAILAKATAWALPFHTGARLATPLFAALFLFALARAATALHGKGAAMAVPLLAVGTLGLLIPLHEAQPGIALLAASATALLGAATLPAQPVAGTVWLAIGTGAAVLFGGLDGFAPVAPLLLLPLLRRQWVALFFAIYLGASVASLWPTFLALRTPEHLVVWWRAELAGAAIHPKAFSLDHLELLAWFTWPVLPIALWAAWRQRRQWRDWPMLVSGVGSLAALAWFLSHEARTDNALPLLPPLTLLAASAAHRLRRGAANAFDWFGAMTLTLFIGLVWLGASAMLAGWPTKIARNFARMEPGFVAEAAPLALAFALALALLWAFALFRLPRSPWRATLRWAAGMTVFWATLMALWLPFIDYGKSYAPVMASLARALPPGHGCIERRSLGLPQRALADLHAGIRTRAEAKGSDCRWLLTQTSTGNDTTPTGWRKVWEGHRAGDRSERLRLYRRD